MEFQILGLTTPLGKRAERLKKAYDNTLRFIRSSLFCHLINPQTGVNWKAGDQLRRTVRKNKRVQSSGVCIESERKSVCVCLCVHGGGSGGVVVLANGERENEAAPPLAR